MKESLKELRLKLLRTGLADLECLGMGFVVLLAMVAVTGFCLGISVQTVYFWLVASVGMAVAAVASWKRACLFTLFLTFVSLMAAYTFSYTGEDTLGCWFPMQWMIREGWNPIRQSGLDAIDAILSPFHASNHHMLVYSKMMPLVGAVVSKGMGVFVAESFLAYVLIFSLWKTAARFADAYWGAGFVARHVFAAAMVFTTKTVGMLGGYVDYYVYLAFLLTLFSLALVCQNVQRVKYGLIYVLASVVLMSVKSNGILFCLELQVVLLIALWKQSRKLAFEMISLVLLMGVFLNLNPLLPTVREFFSESKPWVDLCGCFSGNEDAMRMGYGLRLVYAWVSPSLVPGHPVFHVLGGVGGFGAGFRVVLMISLCAAVMSKRNFALWLAVVVFVTGNLLPLRYIGYARYSPQVWAVPTILFFNFLYFPRFEFFRKIRVQAFIQVIVIGVLFVASSGLAFRMLSFAKKNLMSESFRQQNIRGMASSGKSFRFERDFINRRETFGLAARMRFADLHMNQDSSDSTILVYDLPHQLIKCDGVANQVSDAEIDACWIGDSPSVWLHNLFSPVHDFPSIGR